MGFEGRRPLLVGTSPLDAKTPVSQDCIAKKRSRRRAANVIQ